jgi:hypothetical protein
MAKDIKVNGKKKPDTRDFDTLSKLVELLYSKQVEALKLASCMSYNAEFRAEMRGRAEGIEKVRLFLEQLRTDGYEVGA